MVQQQDLPIDIHVGKLLDWLLSRRHCDKTWHAASEEVRAKITHALQDMPEHEDIKQLLSSSNLNYFTCVKIVDILKETDKDTRNMFGFYSSQRIKDWFEVLKLYEKNGVFLAESAQLLMRTVNYEIPNLKKLITKSEHTYAECDKRQNNCIKSSKNIRAQYYSACEKVGLKGECLLREVNDLLTQFPELLTSIHSKCVSVSHALKYYRDFVSFSCASVDSDNILPTLKFLIEHGNVTVYQLERGHPPDLVHVPDTVSHLELPVSQSAITDKAQTECDVEDIIDFGDEDDVSDGIDWGIESTDQIEVVNTDTSVGAGGGEEHESGVARGEQALSVLENQSTRERVVIELIELETFLARRRLETAHGGDCDAAAATSSGAGGLLHVTPPALQMVTAENLLEMTAAVSAALADLSSLKLHQLTLIRSSARYVDRLLNPLHHQWTCAERLLSTASDMERQKQNITESICELQRALNVLSTSTKHLRHQLEQAISAKYHQRPVNIMIGANII